MYKKHEGRIPLRIKAVPEGTVVPTRNVLFTVENTDPMVPWLTNFFEVGHSFLRALICFSHLRKSLKDCSPCTQTILVQVWYPMTVATNSRYQKEILAKYLLETGESLQGLHFKLHDFGYRGVSSVESAAIGGAAHLVNFMGSDTVASLAMVRKYYHCPMAGFSVPATEHSTMTTWGREGELDACRNMLEKFPRGIVSVVSDSYNVWNVCENIWGEDLKDMIVERGRHGGRLVVRPDSGDPEKVVVKVLEILGHAFGTRTNCKGYKVLPSYLSVLQGDGVSYETLGSVLENMKLAGWSAENVIFGSGGALLQRIDRDTQKCAYKCCHAVINGQGINVYKDPITDSGKKSKKGRLTLEMKGGTFTTIQEGLGDDKKDLLQTVFENGHLVKEYTFDEIRHNAELDVLKNGSQ
ncbi:unnamed protein product [Darwinula stevensoni]|uniref:Nicotinamide phosphoribosyltransferase n=1 Tax=Darwinula stevensoni TaxID=69355 RepID=A0A7R8X6J8_9CRUS|nr:unnamed protein product [Darwinula stevensoni]CAG0879526.1 unnamed protein product [Darwinula stevensoni]